MLLHNLQLINGTEPVSIKIDGGRIGGLVHNQTLPDPVQLTFNSALAFPGLINSHDHLEFNCFPQLGNKVYNNYMEWGTSIQQDYRKEIDDVLKIPIELRTEWGIYKNLLAGVTTVAQHGYVSKNERLVTIIDNVQNIHSVGFEKYWKLKLNNPLKKNMKCVIHTGEGISSTTGKEIEKLIRYNFLRRDLVGVHALAMNCDQAAKFRGVVWCPMSNNFLFKRTADISRLQHSTRLSFGTDSTLTGTWNIWDHFRHARNCDLTDDASLSKMFTYEAARLWDLNCGELKAGTNADIVIAESAGNCYDSFYSLNPENILLIVQKGNIQLFDHSMYPQLKNMKIRLTDFSKILINGSLKYVQGDLPGLMRKIKKYNPGVEFPISTAA